MDKINIKELLEEQFENDPLMQHIKTLGLTEYLYDEEFLSHVNTNFSYSLSQAAEILGEKDHNLRNYLNRHGLDGYIQPTRTANGKLYRINYDSLFKFRMIFTLVNYAERKPSDIAVYVGAELEHRVERKPRENEEEEGGNIPSFIDSRINNLEKAFIYLRWQKKIDDVKNELKRMEQNIYIWENQKKILGTEIENLELRKKDLLSKKPKDIEDNDLDNKGLFGFFKKRKVDSKAIEENVKAKVGYEIELRTIESELKEKRESFQKLDEEKEKLLNKKEEKSKELENIQLTYKTFKDQLESGENNEYIHSLVEGLNNNDDFINGMIKASYINSNNLPRNEIAATIISDTENEE